MNSQLTPDTIARHLQEWERFFLTDHEAHTSSADSLEAFEADYCPDMLRAAAWATTDAYLHALAARCDMLETRWMARQDEAACDAGSGCPASTTKSQKPACPPLEDVRARSACAVFDIRTGQQLQ